MPAGGRAGAAGCWRLGGWDALAGQGRRRIRASRPLTLLPLRLPPCRSPGKVRAAFPGIAHGSGSSGSGTGGPDARQRRYLAAHAPPHTTAPLPLPPHRQAIDPRGPFNLALLGSNKQVLRVRFK